MVMFLSWRRVMVFGYLSLLPPLVAIVLAVFTRKVILPLASGVAIGALLLGFGRVEFLMDLGTKDGALVKVSAPSPWLSGTHFFVEFSSAEIGTKQRLICSYKRYRHQNEIEEGVSVVLNRSTGQAVTVAEFVEEFNSTISLAQPYSATLLAGDPETEIDIDFGRRFSLHGNLSWKSVGIGEKSVSLARTEFISSLKIFSRAIYDAIVSTSHLQALVFSLLLAAMVGTLEYGGGMRVLIERISVRIKTRRAAQTMIASSGLAVFFDDYANTLLLGGTMRPTADRYKISREKLAYFVDSTAAPVAGIALISTWTAIEISYLADGLANAGIDSQSRAFELFLQSIPYRFYPWLALVMVFTIAWTQRDFGPMFTAENGRFKEEEDSQVSTLEEDESSNSKLWLAAVAPVVLCLVTVLAVLVYTGRQQLVQSGEYVSSEGFLKVGQVFGNGDSYLALMFGGAVGLASAIGLHCAMGRTFSVCLRGALRGGKQMLPAMVILWFAWSLSAMTEKASLDTGGYLASLLSDQISATWLPTLVFLLSALMAFSTGTSWGTMGILTPLSVGLSIEMIGLESDVINNSPIVFSTAGAVLAGAIFGDHCSPISDTTVLSSRASGCDHLAHVKTQMPYAMLVGLICVLFGTIPAAYGLSPWVCLMMGTIVIIVSVRFVGRPSTALEDSTR